MNKVLLTGASSFLGYHVAKQLNERGIRPRVLERSGSSSDDRDDRREERNPEADHVDGGEDEARDGDHRRRAPADDELIRTPLPAAPGGRSSSGW